MQVANAEVGGTCEVDFGGQARALVVPPDLALKTPGHHVSSRP